MSDKPDIAISDGEWRIVSDILQALIPEHQVWAFGSRARHTPKPFSDLDLVIRGGKPLDLAQMAALTEAFSDADLPWKVDIVDWANISDAFRDHIDAHKVLIQ